MEKLFRTADDFYASMGMRRAPESLFERSLMRRPTDGRQVLCHATAWDFYDKKVRTYMNSCVIRKVIQTDK